MTDQYDEPLEEHVFDSEQNAPPDKTKLIVFIACAVVLYAVFYIIQSQSWRYTIHHFSSPVINIYSLAPKLVIPGLIASFACAIAADGFGLNRLVTYTGTIFTLFTIGVTWFMPEYFHSKIPYLLSIGPAILNMMLVTMLAKVFFPEGKINMTIISIFYFSSQIFPLIITFFYSRDDSNQFPGSVVSGLIVTGFLIAGIALIDLYVMKNYKHSAEPIKWKMFFLAAVFLAVPLTLGEFVFPFVGSVLINMIDPRHETWNGWLVPLLVYLSLAGCIFLLSLKFKSFSPHWLTGFSFFLLCVFLFLALIFPWLVIYGSVTLLIIHHLMFSLYKLGILGWAIKSNRGKNPGIAFSLIGVFHIASVYLTSYLITPEKLVGPSAQEFAYTLSFSVLLLSFLTFIGFFIAARNESQSELPDINKL